MRHSLVHEQRDTGSHGTHPDSTDDDDGKVELSELYPSSIRFSPLRVSEPATPTRDIDAAESLFKEVLDSRQSGGWIVVANALRDRMLLIEQPDDGSGWGETCFARPPVECTQPKY